jgi:hypothetical protein
MVMENNLVKQKHLSKYLSKSGRKDVSEYGFPSPIYEPKIDGKIWDCSNDLKVKRFAWELDTTTEANIKTALETGTIKKLDFPNCSVFPTKNPEKELSMALKTRYDQWKK